jgi:hypothetical protein
MEYGDDGETGVDNEVAEQASAGVGAWILGRNMFGPVRGPWPDESWRGWWGRTTRERRSRWRGAPSSTS